MPYNGIQTIVICQDYFWAALLIERFIRGSEVVFRGRCITICVRSSVITLNMFPRAFSYNYTSAFGNYNVTMFNITMLQ